MNALLIVSIIAIYFVVLVGISWVTSRHATTETFFTAHRSSPWYLVAFGMIGASLSGVTFVSVPGEVGVNHFAYFQIVMGYVVGYLFIVFVLLPLYYQLNLVSIYTYLEQRFGKVSYLTGSFYFLLSRTVGAAFRLYLATEVLQTFVFGPLRIPFEWAACIMVALIWAYTFKGGIKTIVWTDTFQTTFLVGSLLLCIYSIKNQLGFSLGQLWTEVHNSPLAGIFVWEANHPLFFPKQFISGAFIAIVMTGLDQDMMQKNLTCKNLKQAQWNMLSFTGILVVVNYLFLMLGALLYIYAFYKGIITPAKTDQLFPQLAVKYLGGATAIFFVLGITASTYASADSALASLTTAFCIDFLGFNARNNETQKRELKFWVHIAFSILLLMCIIIFKIINNDAVITAVFKAAGYTYGPLLGLFFFGLFTSLKVSDKYVWLVCLASPIISWFINSYSSQLFNGYKFGFEILLVNGALTFAGLYLLSIKANHRKA